MFRQAHEENLQGKPWIDVALEGVAGFKNVADPLHDLIRREAAAFLSIEGQKVGVDHLRASSLQEQDVTQVGGQEVECLQSLFPVSRRALRPVEKRGAISRVVSASSRSRR